MRLALIQQHATADRAENLRRGLEAARNAAAEGAQVIAFAELAFDLFHPQNPATPEKIALAEPVPGPTTEAFSDLARELGVVVVLNLYEQPGGSEGPEGPEGAGLPFDSSPVIDADGTLLGATRMVHITDYEFFHEQDYYAPGDRGAPVYETKLGNIGVAICYDRHYPEYMRALALGGAELVVIPQAGSVGEWPDGLYEAEMQVAAFQNGYFTALCNRVGEEENLTFSGESFVCGPDGRVRARAAEGIDAVLLCDIDLGECATSHARTLFLRDRRPELYPDWLGR